MRGLAQVRGEPSLTVLCYNFNRVLTMIGREKLIAWLAASFLWPEIRLLRGVLAPLGRILAGFYRWGATTRAPDGRPAGCPPTLNAKAGIVA